MNKFRDGNAEWAARIFLDKTVKENVQFEVNKLALAVLGNHQLRIEESKDPEGYDRYSYCKHTTKQFCPVGNKKWKYRGHFKEYVVHGNTRLDIYLEVLRMLGNDNSTYYPIVSFRPDSE